MKIEFNENELYGLLRALEIASLVANESVPNRNFYTQLWMRIQTENQSQVKEKPHADTEPETNDLPTDSSVASDLPSANGHRAPQRSNRSSKRRANSVRR